MLCQRKTCRNELVDMCLLESSSVLYLHEFNNSLKLTSASKLWFVLRVSANGNNLSHIALTNTVCWNLGVTAASDTKRHHALCLLLLLASVWISSVCLRCTGGKQEVWPSPQQELLLPEPVYLFPEEEMCVSY